MEPFSSSAPLQPGRPANSVATTMINVTTEVRIEFPKLLGQWKVAGPPQPPTPSPGSTEDDGPPPPSTGPTNGPPPPPAAMMPPRGPPPPPKGKMPPPKKAAVPVKKAAVSH